MKLTDPITAVQTQPSARGSRHEQHYANVMQKANRARKCYTNTDSISKFDNKDEPMAIDKEPNTVNYFLQDPNQDNDKRRSAEITQQLQLDFKDVFTGIGGFDGTFSLQVKPDSKPYQAPLRHVAYALQKHFKEELESLQQQDITTPLSMDDTAK